MAIETSIANNTAAILELVATLRSFPGLAKPISAPVEDPMPKKRRSSTVETPADTQPVVEETQAVQPEPVTESLSEEISDVDFRQAATDAARRNTSAVKAMLAALGVANLTAVPQAARPQFLKELETV